MSFNPIEIASNAEMRGKALACAEWGLCIGLSKGNFYHADIMFAKRNPQSRFKEMIHKSTVAAGTPSDSTWAAPIAQPEALSDAFIQYLRPLTIIGRLQGFKAVPFNVKTTRANVGSNAAWTGAGATTPVSSLSLETISLEHAKLNGIVPFTRELARLGTPEAAAVFRDDLAKATASASDVAFLDPSLAAVPNVSPASVTYGAPTIAATGSTASAFRDDLKSLLGLVTTNLEAPYLLMQRTTAVQLATLGDSSGLLENVGAFGGTIGGIPVLTSTNVPADADSPSDSIIVLLDSAELFVADSGVEFSSSEQALLEMTTNPDSPAGASTTMLSLWQHDIMAIKVSRFMNWKLRRGGAVAYLTGVNYSS
ncbi:HK97 family phage major capsid protein [Bradyrhizobium niftali]|uniref:phage major capsid protein n=1 Tax=Bradyrhizobium niftali TaxID=2560055 RepID=UPI0038324CBA